jgi:hypothetical protein
MVTPLLAAVAFDKNITLTVDIYISKIACMSNLTSSSVLVDSPTKLLIISLKATISSLGMSCCIAKSIVVLIISFDNDILVDDEIVLSLNVSTDNVDDIVASTISLMSTAAFDILVEINTNISDNIKF